MEEGDDYPSRNRKPSHHSMQYQEEEEEEDYSYNTQKPTRHHTIQQRQQQEQAYNYNTNKPTHHTIHQQPQQEDEEDYHSKNTNKPTHHHPPASSSDLLSSAKYMAEAAQHAFRHETDQIDRSRLAGAAEDVLEAASRYGKLQDSGFGQYIEKAESYLHQYHTPSAASGHGGAQPSHGGGSHSHSEGGGGGGGYGDYLKMAEGFLKKH